MHHYLKLWIKTNKYLELQILKLRKREVVFHKVEPRGL